MCVRKTFARGYQVVHHEVVPRYVQVLAFSKDGVLTGVLGNLCFDSHAVPEVRYGQIRSLGSCFREGAGALLGRGVRSGMVRAFLGGDLNFLPDLPAGE